MNKFVLFLASLIAVSCSYNNKQKENPIQKVLNQSVLHSQYVNDSFYINISLLNNYIPSKQYPVMYLLDGNMYFNMMSSISHNYSDVGLMPEIIIVGISYKDFAIMDSLRDRDYTFPTALPKYEMSVSGGAEKFLSFINKELKPFINKQYKIDANQQILFGHSLGGYFTMYCLHQDIKNNTNNFQYYIAASPSLNYNNYYLVNEFKQLSLNYKQIKTKAYITFGELEDKDDEDIKDNISQKHLIAQIHEVLIKKQSQSVDCKFITFSNLQHFDTPLPTFTKALKEMVVSKD